MAAVGADNKKRNAGSVGTRAVSAILSGVFCAGILLLIIMSAHLTPSILDPESRPIIVELLPEPEPEPPPVVAPPPKPPEKFSATPGGSTGSHKPAPSAARQARTPVRNPEPPRAPVLETRMSEKQFAQMPEFGELSIGGGLSGAASGSGGNGSGSGAGEGDGAENGSGVRLYASQWVKKPTNEDLHPFAHFIDKTDKVGRVVLACRVRLDYHVRNCRVLKEVPEHHGFARAAMAAVKIFRVYPPKVDGTPIDNAWVAIPISYVPH